MHHIPGPQTGARYYPANLLPRMQRTLRELADTRLRFDHESEALRLSPLPSTRKAEAAKDLEDRRRKACAPLEERLRQIDEELRTFMASEAGSDMAL